MPTPTEQRITIQVSTNNWPIPVSALTDAVTRSVMEISEKLIPTDSTQPPIVKKLLTLLRDSLSSSGLRNNATIIMADNAANKGINVIKAAVKTWEDPIQPGMLEITSIPEIEIFVNAPESSDTVASPHGKNNPAIPSNAPIRPAMYNTLMCLMISHHRTVNSGSIPRLPPPPS